MALNLEEYRSGEDMNGFQYQSFLPSHINDRWIWDTRIKIDDIDATTLTSTEGYPCRWGTSKRWVILHDLANSGGVYETKNSLCRPGCR